MFRLTGSGMHRYTRRQLRHDLAAARAECLRLDRIILDQDNRIATLEENNAQLKADHVDVGVERQLREQAEERAQELAARLVPYEAKRQNDCKTDVPQMYRDIDFGERPTEPDGIRHVGDEFPDDYLNHTRQTWHARHRPVGPAVLDVTLTEPGPGDGQRFAATARVAAHP
jgi:hypothetical protein